MTAKNTGCPRCNNTGRLVNHDYRACEYEKTIEEDECAACRWWHSLTYERCQAGEYIPCHACNGTR